MEPGARRLSLVHKRRTMFTIFAVDTKGGKGKDFIVGGWQVRLAAGRCILHAGLSLPIHLQLVPWLEFHDAVCYFARSVLFY